MRILKRESQPMDSDLDLDLVIDGDFKFEEYVSALQIEVDDCLNIYHAEAVYDSVAIIKRLRERLKEAERKLAGK